ncbi:MAG: hypothetical protein AB7N71_07355, partial [Phycisphaerae bacterium]
RVIFCGVLIVSATTSLADEFTWIGGDGAWNNRFNWLEGVVPTSGATVYIDGGNLVSSSVSLGLWYADLDGLTIDENDRFLVDGSGSARLANVINNAGEIVVSSGFLSVDTAVEFAGLGTVHVSNLGYIRGAHLSSQTDTLTISADQILTTQSDNVDFGPRIECLTVNNFGTIEAQSGQFRFRESSVINQGVIAARDGGQIRIENDLDNRNGRIESWNGGHVLIGQMGAELVAGGVFGGDGVIELSTFTSILFDAVLEPLTIESPTQLHFGRGGHNPAGVIINEGKICIGIAPSVAPLVRVEAQFSIQGDGIVELCGTGSKTIQVNGAGSYFELGSGQILRTAETSGGTTAIAGAFKNFGELDITRGFFRFSLGPSLNRGTMKFSQSVHVSFTGSQFDNTGGEIFLDNPASFTTGSSTLVGGVLSYSSGTTITTPNPIPPAPPPFSGVTLKNAGAPGTLNYLSGTPAFDSSCVTVVQLGGYAAGIEHDFIQVGTTAYVGGTLRAVALNEFQPVVGDRFTILNAQTINGSFTAFDAADFSDKSLTIRADTSSEISLDLVVVRLADMNCDGALTVSDIGWFIKAITTPEVYHLDQPDCEILNADTNADGAITVSDIGDFVALLTSA